VSGLCFAVTKEARLKKEQEVTVQKEEDEEAEKEALARGREKASRMSQRMVTDLAGQMSIPKLKEFIKNESGVMPKSSAKKPELVAEVLKLSEKKGWEASFIALQNLLAVQARGFSGGSDGGKGSASGGKNGGKKKK